jgi:predicted PurR-regulated permease PerM
MVFILTIGVVFFGFYRLLMLASEIESEVNQLHLQNRQKLENLQREIQKKSIIQKEIEIEDITQALDISTHSVEKIHRTIAETSFSLISSVKPVKKPTEAIQKAHDLTSKEVYGSLRKVNKLVGQLSRNLGNDPKKNNKGDS